MRENFIDYLEDLVDDMEDLGDDFKKHLFRKPDKLHKKVKKKVGKRGRPALALAERIRGVIYLIVGASVIYAAFVASTEGIVGLSDLMVYLIIVSIYERQHLFEFVTLLQALQHFLLLNLVFGFSGN